MQVDIVARPGRMRQTPHRSSMLQDLLAGKPLEIDAQSLAAQVWPRQTI
ncbi:ketopantoate reductase C-terminal domain-containing protein [Bordetella genomosp. 10]|nr:ketopantoate reductase C-terminal domain-containing protein [Bordetella genomosp. 10]